MEHTLQQSQKLSQGMVMSSVMLQKLSLLTYPVLQLREEILKEVQNNPALDIELEPQYTSLEYLESEKFNGPTIISTTGNSFTIELENLLEAPKTLAEHLKWQLHMENLDDTAIEIGEMIIDNLDDRGFLCDDPLFLCRVIDGANETNITKVQKIVQLLSPVGCAVWNESESILLQAEQLSLSDEEKQKLEEYCALLYHQNMNPSIEQDFVQKFQNDKILQQVLHYVTPYPGYIYMHQSYKIHDAIVPDAVVRVEGETLRVEVNNDIIPVLTVSEDISRLTTKEDKETKKAAEEMIRNAEQFIEGLRYREYIFEKVVIYVVNMQKDFLLSKTKDLLPLSQKEVAEILQVHISTVSRIVGRKFVETPQGLLPLQKFFTQRDEVQKVFSSKVIESIANIVAQYKGKKHLSDRMISEQLEKQGLVVARRTVAKYRKLLQND